MTAYLASLLVTIYSTDALMTLHKHTHQMGSLVPVSGCLGNSPICCHGNIPVTPLLLTSRCTMHVVWARSGSRVSSGVTSQQDNGLLCLDGCRIGLRYLIGSHATFILSC